VQREPAAWAVLIGIALIPLIAHLLTGGRFGIFRDEYYYLACASHLDWGYVDHPPLSIAFLAGWRAVFGDSVHMLRLPAALAGAGLVLLAGLLAREMGGRRLAQGLAAFAVAVSPVTLSVTGFYSMNFFELLVWTGAAILLVRILRDDERGLWPWLGVLLGLGLLNKISVTFLGASMALGFLLTPARRQLADRRLWLGAAIAVLIFLPHLIWQIHMGWPTLEFIANAKQYKIADTGFLDFLLASFLESGPTNLPLMLAGLIWLLLARASRPFRALGWIWPATFAILVLQQSKPYYLAGAHPILFAAGAVALGGFLSRGRRRWIAAVLVVNMLAGGLFTLPFTIPVFSPQRTADYITATGIVAPAGETAHRTLALPQHLADRLGWPEQVEAISRAYGTLSPEERAECVAISGNYGGAGAVDYYRARGMDLPPTACFHNSYWYWLPERSGRTAIVVDVSREALEDYFDFVEEAERLDVPDVPANIGGISVWICRGGRFDLATIWPEIKNFI